MLLQSGYACASIDRAAGRVVPFQIDVLGRRLRLSFDVARGCVRLVDLVPLARAVCSKVTETLLDEFRRSGQSVPCCKGCPACCNYLVPLSVPEALALIEQTSVMPQPQRTSLIEACTTPAGRILEKGPDLFGSGYFTLSQSPDDTAAAVADWYAGLELECPFLSDGSCMIYAERPLACREHFVIGSPCQCADLLSFCQSTTPAPVSVLRALAELTAHLEQSSLETIMLPLVFAWAEHNAARSKQTWPAISVAETFAEILTRASLSAPALTATTA
jgi:Fe-S-cluster containining protein